MIADKFESSIPFLENCHMKLQILRINDRGKKEENNCIKKNDCRQIQIFHSFSFLQNFYTKFQILRINDHVKKEENNCIKKKMIADKFKSSIPFLFFKIFTRNSKFFVPIEKRRRLQTNSNLAFHFLSFKIFIRNSKSFVSTIMEKRRRIIA